MESAGEQGRDREQPEGGQHAEHQGEQQLHRDAPSGLLGASPAIKARIERETIERGEQRGAVTLGTRENPHERTGRLTEDVRQPIERVGDALPAIDLIVDIGECSRPCRWGATGHGGERKLKVEPGAQREHEQVDDVGLLRGDGVTLDGGAGDDATHPPRAQRVEPEPRREAQPPDE